MSMRITGLASGMDIDAMVKQLMDAHRIPFTKLQQKKQLLEWQRDDYRSMNSKILEVRNMAFDMQLNSSYNSRSATTASTSFTVSGTSSATEGQYTMKVVKLAKSASATSASNVGASSGAALLSSVGLASDSTMTIKGEKGTSTIVVKGAQSIDEFVKNVNNQANQTGVKVSYDSTLDRFFFVSAKTGEASGFSLTSDNAGLISNVLKLSGGVTTSGASEKIAGSNTYSAGTDPLVSGSLTDPQTLKISRDGVDYTYSVSTSTTVDDFLADFNGSAFSSSTGVKASLDGGKLVFTNPDESKELMFSDDTADGEDIVASVGFAAPTVTPTVGRQTVTGTQAFATGSTQLIDDTLTTDQTLRIRYNGVDYNYTINKDTSIGTLIKNINGSELGKAGVSAYLDGAGKLAFSNPDETKSLTITDQTSDGKDMVAKLGFASPVTVNNQSSTTVTAAGRDAEIEFNGVTGYYATNTFQINGLNFTAKAEMTSAETVAVTQDVDGVFNKIKSFVEKYNEMIDLVNGELTEKRYRDFQPLTEEQRKDMSEDEIKKWEERAKSGMLRSDQLLTSALSNLRTSLTNSVTGLPSNDLKHLSEIGITTGDYSERGKLYIDETKLKAAIAEKPDQVAALFTTNDGVKGASSTDGLAVRFLQQADAVMGKIKTKAGTASSANNSFDLGKNLDDLEDEMDNWTRRLDMLQTRYYKQFTAMEEAINRMNTQSSYLMSQFSSGQ